MKTNELHILATVLNGYILYKRFFTLACTLIPLFIFSQTFNYQSYTVEEGLAQNIVLSTYQDRLGRMWFGTNGGGVSVYDGTEMRNLTERDGLVNNRVFSVEELRNGDFVLGTNKGLSIYSKRKFRNYTTENGLLHELVFSTHQSSKSDKVWVGTRGGLMYLENDTILPFNFDSTLKKAPIFNIYEDLQGNMWFNTITHGTFRWDGHKIHHFTVKDGLTHEFVRCVLEDKSGDGWWVGTARGLNKIDKHGGIQTILMNENESTITITGLLYDVDGTFWIGSKVGLNKYSNNKFHRFSVQTGLPSNEIWTMTSDREGNVWMGTEGSGVIKFQHNGDKFRNFGKHEGLLNEVINALYEDRNGNMWIGTNKGTYSLKEHDIGKFDLNSYVKMEDGHQLDRIIEATSIIEMPNGEMWFSTRTLNSGIIVFDGSNFREISKEDGLPDNIVDYLYKDRDGKVWIGTYKGVAVYDGEKITKVDGIDENHIWCIYQDFNDAFWFATENGVVRYKNGEAKRFTAKDGLVDDRVRSIIQDRYGMLWFATSKGIFRYNFEKFDLINEENGLTSEVVYSIILDEKGSLWAGTSKGIDRISIEAYNQKGSVVIKHYGKKEGFIGVECNQNAVSLDKKGHLWFGTVKGATVFDGSLDGINEITPLTYLKNIRYEFEDFDWSIYADSVDQNSKIPHGLIIPYNLNHLTFDFVGVSLVIPEKVRYQYKLEGLDHYWIPTTHKNEAIYSHIPPGNYTFKIKSVNNDDQWTPEPIEFVFQVLPPWYQTWWFYTLSILLGGGVVFIFISYRTRRLKRQKIYLEEQVALRTKELREEKEKVEQINLEVIQKNKIIEEKNKDITDSINYAQRIQAAILPKEQDRLKMFKDSFVILKPKDIVSGDFYWMGQNKDKVLFTAADCTGHGVPGAFMSMIGNSLLNQVVNKKGIYMPDLILNEVRDGIISSLQQTGGSGEQKDGMDMALCMIDKKTGVLNYAGANNPLYVIRKGHSELKSASAEHVLPAIQSVVQDDLILWEIKADKQPVGYFTETMKPFFNHSIILEEGDTVYVASDGYADQFGGPAGKKFKYKTFKQLLVRLNNKSMDEQHDELLDVINDWMEGQEQIDDICIIGVRV